MILFSEEMSNAQQNVLELLKQVATILKLPPDTAQGEKDIITAIYEHYQVIIFKKQRLVPTKEVFRFSQYIFFSEILKGRGKVHLCSILSDTD